MQNLLGAFYLLLFLGGPIVAILWFIKKFGPGIEARKRDREIETAMRLGLRDAQAQQRIARQIAAEYRNRER